MTEAPLMNCIVIDDDNISRSIIEKYIEKVDFLTLRASFSNPEEALEAVTNKDGMSKELDLILLDIEMPQMSGMEFLKYLKTDAQIILITTEPDHAVEAYEYDVTDYIVKPLTFPRFLKAVSRAREEQLNLFQLKQQPQGQIGALADVLFIKFNSRYVKIPLKDILWIEAIGDYVEIHTLQKKYTVHSTMKAIESRLNPAEFIRVHRSYIINLPRISEIEDNTLIIEKKLIPIGKSYRDKLLQSLNLI